jgi:hypothetical protein
MIIACVCLGAAAISLWRQRTDAAFVSATLGAVAWLLNYRIQIKESITPATLDTIDDKGMDDTDEE